MFSVSDSLLLIGLAVFVAAFIVAAIRDVGPVERRREGQGLRLWLISGLLLTAGAFGWKAVMWAMTLAPG